MPNQAHVALLLAGIENWNEWVRQQRISRQYGTTRHAGAKIGVSSFYADLREADLSGADLYQGKAGAGRTGADLIGADLRGANLRGAKLGWANLTGATLANADLSGATLMNSRLDGANLSGADLSDATLGGANLLQANLSGATLNNTYLYHTDFSDTNLDRAIGLETCRYAGPCTIDHRTMFEYEPLPIHSSGDAVCPRVWSIIFRRYVVTRSNITLASSASRLQTNCLRIGYARICKTEGYGLGLLPMTFPSAPKLGMQSTKLSGSETNCS
jgi:hypothetical protein